MCDPPDSILFRPGYTLIIIVPLASGSPMGSPWPVVAILIVVVVGIESFEHPAMCALCEVYRTPVPAGRTVPILAFGLNTTLRGPAPQCVSPPPLSAFGPCTVIVSPPVWIILPLVGQYLYRVGMLDEFAAPGIALSCT